MTSRREKLESLLTESPDDTFLRYAYAIELFKEGRQSESESFLTALARANPPYVPAYFQAARQALDGGVTERARAWLREGIEVARAQGDHHAAGEMSELLTSLGTQG